MSEPERVPDQLELQEAAETAATTPQTAAGRIQKHYHDPDVADVYRTLGQVSTGHAVGNSDFIGWYRTRDAAGDWNGQGRAWAISKEWDRLRRDVDRVVYTTISYAPAEWFMQAWDCYRWEGSDDNTRRAWKKGNTPTPDYSDLTAYAPFADIDLADDVKASRPSGDIPKTAVEKALARYIDAFAELAGSRQHVFALDSVGGAYVFIAPTSTAPISQEFSGEKRAVIFSELTDALNSWLGDVRDSVIEEIPKTDGTFTPDKLNNKNRLFKAPLSVHSSLDGVVTPLDTQDPSYDFTPLTAVDDSLITEAVNWAAEYTDDHTAALDTIVATLWPEHASKSWEAALETVAEESLNDDGTGVEIADTGDSTDSGGTNEDLINQTHTTQKRKVLRAVERIDSKDVVKDLCDDWKTANRDPPRFKPGYRGSSSGTSCFVNSEGKIVDNDDEVKAFDVVTYTAREKNIIRNDATATGSDWWKAVEELRSEGYDIPRYTGDDDISAYYAYPLTETARSHDYGDPLEDDTALLRACLQLRDRYEDLEDEQPPYDALVQVAKQVDLPFDRPSEDVLGKTSYKVARRMFNDFTADDVDTEQE